jgi:phosphate:Na+ symporter
MIASLLGGLGLFLLGMVLLTDGLKALAGDALRRILTRLVAGPISGIAWGALITAVVQSSHATTLATVGFVSAGLLSFSQAVGVVFGANLGTTSTGWIVSQLGFKVSLGAFSSPLVLIGVLLRLLSHGRAAHFGAALCGFGLLFIGIDLLQGGMTGVSERISPGDLPGSGAGLAGRAALVGIGFIMTILTQSSSASMATTLAAVSSGAISLDQAAAMIIGQNVGSSPTAVAAAIGAPTAAKRTALAHVMFNVLTAGVAFAALPALLAGTTFVGAALAATDAPTLLALFHTGFNLLGVALLAPLTGPFARLIERVVPEREAPGPTRFLAAAVAEVGPVALEAARRALTHIVADAARAGGRLLAQVRDARGVSELSAAEDALAEVRRFVHGLAQAAQGSSEVRRQTALLHACDHAARLIRVLRAPPPRRALDDAALAHVAAPAGELVRRFAALCATSEADARSGRTPDLAALAEEAERLSREIARLRRTERRAALADAAAGRLDPEAAVERIDGLLWFDRLAYHLWRASRRLATDAPDDDEQTPEPPEDAVPPPPAGG